VAALISALLLTAATPPDDPYDRYVDCVAKAAVRLERSGESAGDVADAALADDECTPARLILEFSPGGRQIAAMAKATARGEAINYVVTKRSAKGTANRRQR